MEENNTMFSTEEEIKILGETIEFVKNFRFEENNKQNTEVMKNKEAA